MARAAAIITGVNSGLGNALALRLMESKFVVGVSRGEASEGPWLSSVKAGNAHHVLGDVADPATVTKTFTSARQAGRLDLVINCAGQGIFGPPGTRSRSDVDEVLRGNLIGTILFCEAAFAEFREHGGTIVNVISTAAHVARANEAIYCASKWGARGYTESLRLEAKSTPVRVIGVYPGGMRTPFWSNAKGSTVDSSTFMDVSEVADSIVVALQSRGSCYVSDISINRK